MIALMITILTSSRSVAVVRVNGFIQRERAKFIDTETKERFVAIGANAFALLYEENGREKGKSLVDKVLEGARNCGSNVLRVWAFTDGDREEFDGRSLQPQVFEYSEKNFEGLDRLLKKCERYEVKLLLTMTNFWDDYGGINQYERWFNAKRGDFFRNERVKEAYKKYIRFVAKRYESNTNVFAFQLINEPRIYDDDGTGELMRAWCKEMIAAFRDVNKNHMLSLGSEGFYSEENDKIRNNVNPFSVAGKWGVDFVEDAEGFDFVTVHLWVDDWLEGASETTKIDFTNAWIRQHMRDAEALEIPVLFEEFGKKLPISVRATYYERVYDLVTETDVNIVQKQASSTSDGTEMPSLPFAKGGILFWHLSSMIKEQYDKDGYAIFIEDEEHEPILDIVKFYHAKISRLLSLSSAGTSPPIETPPASMEPPVVEEPITIVCENLETNARYDITPFLHYGGVINAIECCALCWNRAHLDALTKKKCEAFAHDSSRRSCYVGVVKDPLDPRKTIGQIQTGWTSGFSPNYRTTTTTTTTITTTTTTSTAGSPSVVFNLPPPPTPKEEEGPKIPELISVIGRSTLEVITAILTFSEPIFDVTFVLGNVYIDTRKASLQSVTNDSKVFFATISRIGEILPFGPKQRRLSIFVPLSSGQTPAFPSVLFFA